MATATTIPFDKLTFSPDLPNVRFHLGDLDSLVDSIRENGLITPILVLRTKKRGQKTFPIIAGHRRYEAIKRLRNASGTQKARFEDIKVTFFDGTIEEAKFVNIAENLDRKNLSPLETADRIKDFLKQGYEQQDIAHRLGRSPAWVSTVLSTARNSGKKVQAALRSGSIKTAHAKELSRLDEADQDALLEKVIQTGMTLRELKKAVDDRLGDKTRIRLRPVSEFQQMLNDLKDKAEDANILPAERAQAVVWLDALCWATQKENLLVSALARRQAKAQF